jgi:hypothetical protein
MKIRCFTMQTHEYIADTMYVYDGNGNLLLYFDYEHDITQSVTQPNGSWVNYAEKRLYTSFVPTKDQLSSVPLKLYPNPTADQVTLVTDLPYHKMANMRVINALGQLVIEQAVTGSGSQTKQVLDVSNLIMGIYYVIIESDEGRGYAVLQVLR